MTATRQEISAAAIATSDRLNAEDLISGPLTIEIEDVNVICGDKGVQKMIINIKDREHPWHTCKSVTRTILAMWQDEPVEWIGRKMVLFRDPDVVFKNDPLGGIRIQAASNLSADFTLTLTEHQKKRITRTIKPLKVVAAKKTLTLTERAKAACNAYDECHDVSRLDTLDTHIDALFADLTNDEDKQAVQVARDAAIARLA